MHKITIFGGSGFVGKYIVGELAKLGYSIVIVTRYPEQAQYLKTAGQVGQIHLTTCDLEDLSKLKRIIEHSEAVINLVGILHESHKAKFNNLHIIWPERLARLCNELAIPKLIHFSALGADKSHSKYARSKLRGEEAIIKEFKNYYILRPSIIFGPDDNFFNIFADLATYSPFLPLIMGGNTKFQPIYVKDVAQATINIIKHPQIKPDIYQLAGNKVYTLREIMELICKYTKRKKLLINIPEMLAKFMGMFLQILPEPILTMDQVDTLKTDSIVNDQFPTIKNLWLINLTDAEQIIPNYLGRYRNSII
ncbi:complex I NDUFA9 subunit family protein [Rickettsiales endosymbiont of Stachyamoeba lipophora]|uniref:complex I NDUFA9 subunit family protein n=1 Tax=Rickettsiales endosymbiont of Stachyamoeba lipophora TaxID=2486578 RepID=UPI000F64FB38|nr:complex I NDUFA9 subunit family protein [Rickettsiales endosymbiont of Stachyamoeba lipophora]AZL15002.1 complex I NDUFA9 subunit family protein [Rickettsiales endosymbiont of Stachyamoeba lipophora]